VSLRSPYPGEDPARAARELLVPALAELQQNKAPTPLGAHALDHVAAAMSSLYAAEAEAATEAGVTSSLREALDELTRALDSLHERTPGLHALDGPATAVARAMALLYPRVRMSERQRRGVVMADAVPNHERRALVAMADRIDSEHLVAAETPAPEQRTAGHRVRVDVDVGVLSESNFYSGVAADMSAGGVFVSTPAPLPVDTEVVLYFTLGDGVTLHAEASVRWIRATTSDLPAGMGVAFTHLSDADRRTIADFCGHRPPLFHD
jgi:uncharacterized protein (TIGR02266 family)